MSKMELVFEEPPVRTAVRGRPAVWKKKLEALKGHEGKWVRIAEFQGTEKAKGLVKARDAARRLRKGQASLPETGKYEFNFAEKDGVGIVYARYLGEK